MTLSVDATDLLATAGNTPTGIPRVHGFLVSQALADASSGVRVVLYDRKVGGYRRPTTQEETILGQAIPRVSIDRPLRKDGMLREALNRIEQNPNLDREFDRNIASRIAGSRYGDGLRYTLLKTSIRVYRLGRRVRELTRSTPSSGTIAASEGTVLFADVLDTIKPFSAGLKLGKNCAFLCHDLIPLYAPGFVSERAARRFTSQLSALIESGARPICTSDASRRMLQNFVSESKFGEIKIVQFPLPSILYESAKAIGRTSRFTPDEPFVLYCSTIDSRKNHLLLAKVWKQAFDEGVELPKLVCVGKWGGAADEVRRYLRAHPELEGQIEFPGAVDDVDLIDLYRSALFGVMPSHIEGWGFGASECLDFVLPVIVSRCPALVEATHHLMPAVDANDQSAWFAKIRELSESAATREALQKKIKEHYTPVTQQESWDVIKAIAGGSAG